MGIRRLASLIAICLAANFAAILASPAAAQVTRTPAGPIFNNPDAQRKCPDVCSRAGREWRGQWRTTGGMQSECDCEGRGSGADRGPGWSHHGQHWDHGGGFAGGSGNSCRAHSVRQCRGCSVSCRPGQSAHCQEGDVGIFRGPNDSICAHQAKCECH
jgi:hypothetical protein